MLLCALLSAGVTGCAEFWTGRPSVNSVDVSVAPKTIAEGQTAQANGIPRKDDGSPISSSRVRVSFSSSDPNIAAVNSQSGVVTAVAPGRVAIIGTAQGKSGQDSITILPADPSVIVVTPSEQIPITVGASTTVTVDPRNSSGLTLPNRTATFTSNDTRVATVTSAGPLSARITAVALGTTQVNITIGSVTKSIVVTVRQPAPGSVALALQTGKTEIQVRESIQLVPTVRDSAGNMLSTFGRSVVYQSSDVTIATVNNNTGVVTGVKEGSVEITVTIDNLANGRLRLQVIPQKVSELRFVSPSFVFRVGGAVRNLSATPLDSAGQRVDRPVSYRSTNEAVATVTSLGLVTPRGLGTARIVATIDNLRDSMTVQVTPVPITSVRVDPTQATANVGETRQYTATLFDSLGNQVTGRTITWQTNNPNLATVSSTGLATARAPGGVEIQAFTDVVPGFAARIGQSAVLVIAPTPIARVQVAPDSVVVRVGGRTSVVIRTFDANGNELFNRATSVVARSANPAIATADATGTVAGNAEGRTTITYQAVDPATGLAQGTPATLTVVVTGSGGGGGG